MGCDCVTSCFVFKWSLVLRFTIDNLQNLTVLLFTSTSSSDFSIQLCGTLLNASWKSVYAILKFFFLLLQPSYIAFDITGWSLQPFIPGRYPFCSAVSKFCSSKCVEILLVIIPVRVLSRVVKHEMACLFLTY